MENINPPNFVKNTKNYQGITPLTYANIEPHVEIASISNCKLIKSLEVDNIINLTPYDLSYNDFMASFYHQPGASFSINPVNNAFKPLLLTSQTYTSTNDNTISWDLYNHCIKAYCEKHSVSESSISTFKKILLNKEIFSTPSLASVSGFQIGLSWDVVIHSLQINNKIVYTKDSDDFANVNFKIGYIYYCNTLDITVEINFTYRTSIPNYRNVYSVNNVDNALDAPYSNNQLTESPSILANFTDISDLLESTPRIKKEKKKDKKRAKRSIYNIETNVVNNSEKSLFSLDNDNDSVLTKNIIRPNKNKPVLQTTFEIDESIENDVNNPW